MTQSIWNWNRSSYFHAVSGRCEARQGLLLLCTAVLHHRLTPLLFWSNKSQKDTPIGVSFFNLVRDSLRNWSAFFSLQRIASERRVSLKALTRLLPSWLALLPVIIIGTVKFGFRPVHQQVCFVTLLFYAAAAASPRYPHRNTDAILCHICLHGRDGLPKSIFF